MKDLSTIAFLLLSVHLANAQSAPSAPEIIEVELKLQVTGTLPRILKEASGLEISSSGLLWTHNDDRYSILYGIDAAGNTVKTVHLNHVNKGWEDLAYDADENIYIGDFGNNHNDRDSLAIYRLKNPDSIDSPIVNAELIRYAYSDQSAFPPPPNNMNFDVDAFISMRDSLYLFTKNRTDPFTGYTKVYKLPRQPGRYAAVLYDSLYLGGGPMEWVTGADISPDGQWLALLSHDCLWIVTGFGKKKFSSGEVYKIPLGHYSHKTGICFSSDSHVRILDELEFNLIGGKIYALDLTNAFRQIELREDQAGRRDDKTSP